MLRDKIVTKSQSTGRFWANLPRAANKNHEGRISLPTRISNFLWLGSATFDEIFAQGAKSVWGLGDV
jgi:hypothetical protein